MTAALGVVSSAGSVVASSPVIVAPGDWVVFLPRLVNTAGSAVEVEVTGGEVASLAAFVVAAAFVSPVAEVVTVALVVLSSSRIVDAAAPVVIVPTDVGVEDPEVVIAADVKSVSKVVESLAPVVTPSE